MILIPERKGYAGSSPGDRTALLQSLQAIKERNERMKTESTPIIRPPQQCRVLSSAYYNDGSIVSDSHMLTWMGEVQIRADPEKDDMWKLCASKDKWVWAEIGDIQVLGRTPGSHYLREYLDNGGNPFTEAP